MVPSSFMISQITNDDGTMARLPELLVFAEQHGLKVGTIADLIAYRSQTESLIEHVAERDVDTPYGLLRLHAFRDTTTGAAHLALVKGRIDAAAETLVRVHEPLSVMDWLDTRDTGHSWSVPKVMAEFESAGSGVLILLHRDETADALLARAFPGVVSEPARKWDPKIYGIGAQILKRLGVGRMRLMSKPLKIPSMTGFSLEVCGYLEAASRQS